MSTHSQGMAVFDFDGTICSRDSFWEFIRYTHGTWRLYGGSLLLLPWIVLYLLKLYPNHRLKEKYFAHFYAGTSTRELTALGRTFALEVLPQWCYPEALEIICWHRQQGHRLYLLTASSGIWLEAWCQEQGMELVGTEWATEQDKYTGRIKGRNCYGREKQRRLQKLLQQHRPTVSYGYGNSSADRYFLSELQHPFRGALKGRNIERWKNRIQGK